MMKGCKQGEHKVSLSAFPEETTRGRTDQITGAIMLFNGRDEILPALQMGSASGLQTTVQRVVVDEDTIGMQICDPTGATFMTSFWELEGRQIKRDVTIICQMNPPSSRTSEYGSLSSLVG
jgi:hypothetical protein